MSRPRKSIYDFKGVKKPSKAEKRHQVKTRITAADRLTEPPPPPATLSTGAKKEWLALAPTVVELGTLCAGDLRAFRQLCETLASQTQLQDIVDKEGLMIPTGTGSHKANPCVKSLEIARNQSHRLLEAFGLTPRSRNYVSRAPEAKSSNRFANIRSNSVLEEYLEDEGVNSDD